MPACRTESRTPPTFPTRSGPSSPPTWRSSAKAPPALPRPARGLRRAEVNREGRGAVADAAARLPAVGGRLPADSEVDQRRGVRGDGARPARCPAPGPRARPTLLPRSWTAARCARRPRAATAPATTGPSARRAPSTPPWTPSGTCSRCATDGAVVLWEDDRHGNSDVYAYRVPTDLSTPGEECAIASGPSEQRKVAVSGDTVVWQDNRSGRWEIYSAKIPANCSTPAAESLVSTGEGNKTNPDISGNTIVWQDDRNGLGSSDI